MLGLILKIAALIEQRDASAAEIDSTVGESSPPGRKMPLKDNTKPNFETLDINISQIPVEGGFDRERTPLLAHEDFHIENGNETAATGVEHQFIPSFSTGSPVQQKNQRGKENTESKSLSLLRNRPEEISVLLQLGEPEPKRRKQCDSLLAIKISK